METIKPGKATFLFTVGTGLASGLGNYFSSDLSDKHGGLTRKELAVGIAVTTVGVGVAYLVMYRMLKERTSGQS